MEDFWKAFEKQAKKKKVTRSQILEQIRKGKNVKFKGHSIKSLSNTRLSKI